MLTSNDDMTLKQRNYNKYKYSSISLDSDPTLQEVVVSTSVHDDNAKLIRWPNKGKLFPVRHKLDNNSSRFMAFLRKFGLILWKNWILRKRHYLITALELILPLFFTFILVTLRTEGGDNFKVTYVNESTTYPVIPIGPPSRDIPFDGGEHNFSVFEVVPRNVTLMYSPDNNHTRVMMNYIKEVIESYRAKLEKISLLGLPDEAEMDKMAKKADVEHDNNLIGGISFVNSFPTNGSLPDNLHYRIRLRTISFTGYDSLHYWQTDQLTPFSAPGPNSQTGIMYLQSQFLLCQHLVAMKFIDMVTKKNLSEEIEVYTQKFPYPPYYKDLGFTQIMQSMLPLFIILSYVFISPSLIKRIVIEKELGTKELMKLMGLPGWIQWLGWFVSNFIMMAISALIIVILLCFVSHTPVLSKSAPELVYIILLLYIASAIAFCFFISSLFSKPTVATAVGVIAWILTYSVPYDLLSQKYEQLSLFQKLSAALLPNLAMGWAIRVIASFEGKNLGLQWRYLAEPAYKGENMCMLHVMLMFFLDTVIYGGLTWYIDHVFPGKYGVGKPWYFLVTKAYWGKQEATGEECGGLSSHPNSPNFEKDPVGLTPAIVIKNLTKNYSNQCKLAVDDLSLNFYEGQITALLGHNGAGKTTTMSMLTGMFAPTQGTAMINGYDIRTQIDSARENIGLCPQHNMLFDILTVSEHLTFFGKLKKLNGKALEGEVDYLLKKLQLTDKRNALAKDLSGGMKRKLSLGISLIGGSKVVMLDEPTSGLDPEARRAIWDLLQEIRVGRCVVLTTHFMEEADVLGDRIAIMAQGKVKCSGTPYFLKKRFGAGYHLNVSKTSNCNVPQLTCVIQRHLPDAYMSSNVNNELSYTLPAEKTDLFPAMFEEFENNLQLLGVHGFGVSVTTMEEVFLKVGSMSENEDETQGNGSESALCQDIGLENSNSAVPQTNNSGFVLMAQQLLGLLLKRWYYAHRRWSLLVAQIAMPVLMVFLCLYINNKIDSSKAAEPALLMDISQYGSTIAVENHTNSENYTALAYRSVFPTGDLVKTVDNVENYLIKLGEDHYESYREEHIVAANFLPSVNGIKKINAMYSGVYLHTLPLTANVIHNTILHSEMSSIRWNIAVENAPLPVDPELASVFNEIMKTLKSMMMGIFIPVGLSFLSSSFVVFPIQERTSKSKHLQLMTGVGGFLFWGASFLWDYLVHFISSCLILVVFATMDDSKMFSGENQLGVVFILLVVYGWAAVPFSYMISFICKLPASGFAVLAVLNMIAGMILSIMIFFFKFVGGPTLQNASDYLQWFFRLLPNYTVTIAFMNMPQIAINNNKCDLYDADDLNYKCSQPEVNINVEPCCPDCGNVCLVKKDYIVWDFPGVGQEIFMLMVDGVFYFILLFLVESGFLYRAWYGLKSTLAKMGRTRATTVLDLERNLIDGDVADEQSRIQNLLTTTVPSDDALLVYDLTKQFWSLRAVDHLSFGVKNAECFGLLGINGAGKTTTFRMLTGDEIMTSGEALLHGVSLKTNHTKFLKKISYCPQFDALLDHLTGRETLLLFARLRGIPEADLKYTINNFIYMFDLTQHADKITMAYSGGNKRKLSAAIAFLSNPPMVFLDEPTTGVDPVARRKLWAILLAAKQRGTSLILTSHSMEECEVLCDRLAIMVNGQFKCIGGIQHLKSKFGQGFTIIAKMGSFSDPNQQAIVQQHLQDFMATRFQGCILKDVHQGLVHYHITDVQTPWRYLFSTMEEAKATFNLEDYSVSQTSLEQVFLSFARHQRIVADPNMTAPA